MANLYCRQVCLVPATWLLRKGPSLIKRTRLPDECSGVNFWHPYSLGKDSQVAATGKDCGMRPQWASAGQRGYYRAIALISFFEAACGGWRRADWGDWGVQAEEGLHIEVATASSSSGNATRPTYAARHRERRTNIIALMGVIPCSLPLVMARVARRYSTPARPDKTAPY